MELTEYREEIRKASEGEVIGAELFKRLADRFSPERRFVLALLSELEVATGGRLDALMDRHGIVPGSQEALRTKIDDLAVQLEPLSWEELMVRFTVAFRPFVELYDRLERNARDEDADALAFLARHERLLLGFAEAELAGDATKPLQQIRTLIASTV